jgi:hypothetical protein
MINRVIDSQQNNQDALAYSEAVQSISMSPTRHLRRFLTQTLTGPAQKMKWIQESSSGDSGSTSLLNMNWRLGVRVVQPLTFEANKSLKPVLA